MALTVVQYEEITALLREVPALVDELAERSVEFPERVLVWLGRAEKALENNRLSACSQVAACRAALIATCRGLRSPSTAMTGRVTPRKMRDAEACAALERSNDVLHSAIAERETVFREAERCAQQVVVLLSAKGLLPDAGGVTHQEWLRSLQRTAAADPELMALAAHLVSLVGASDVLVFLDRAVAKVLFGGG